uniref:Uncharacterized protein n=1 Tax=Panagrolaimus sp. JU765 TaxID=591449 RepID=A0AC34R768_9BILA
MDGKRELVKTKLKLFLAKKKDPELNSALDGEEQTKLVESLLDGTVCQIVDSLQDLQRLKENELMEERTKKLAELQNSGGNFDEGIRGFDLEILKQMDELVADQQSHLSCAHVALFKQTTDPSTIRIQMEIMEFILSLIPILNKS